MCSTALQDVTSLNRGLFALLEPALQQELGGVLFGPQLWHRLSTVIEIKMMLSIPSTISKRESIKK
jgi:hypothetical protein